MSFLIRLKNGLFGDRTTITPENGEPVWYKDENVLHIGDGTTAGGVPVKAVASNIVIHNGEPTTSDVHPLDYVWINRSTADIWIQSSAGNWISSTKVN